MSVFAIQGSGTYKVTLGTAVALSLYAALTHALAAPDHLEEWWGYRTFMVVAAVAQAVFAAMLAWSSQPRYRRLAVIAGIGGNALIVALYVFTRTVGIPIGPEAGEVEAVGDMGWIDVTATLAEILLVAVLLAHLLISWRRKRADDSKGI